MLPSNLELESNSLRGRIAVTPNFEGALDVLAEITQELGFTQVLYGYMPVVPRLPNGEWLPLKLNVRCFPNGWEDGWEQFTSVDPYYRACFQGTLPIDWTDVQKSDQLTRTQRMACDYLGDFGLSHGITIPVHLPFGRFAVMSAIADNSCANWRNVREEAREPLFKIMHIFTKAIHDRHFELQIPATRPVRLTPREEECMRWASLGKTSAEIAIILGRSIETVRMHVKNSIKKLNATNRIQAVSNAIHLGLI
jgi:LuxR family transcriptional regulator